MKNDIFKYTKNYQVLTAFCFSGTKMHIQMCNFGNAEDAIKFIEEDKARSEKWKAEGHTLSEMEIYVVNVYSENNVSIYQVSEAELRSHAAEKKEGVS